MSLAPNKIETLVASRTETVTGNSAELSALSTTVDQPVASGQVATRLRLGLSVTAASGTSPTMTVDLQDSFDGTDWFVVASFAEVVAVSESALNVTAPFTNRLRFLWTIGGDTPSFTFSIDGIGLLG